jgi:hypothetical protein
MNYGDAVLGVECALLREFTLRRRPSHARQFTNWLLAAFARRT